MFHVFRRQKCDDRRGQCIEAVGLVEMDGDHLSEFPQHIGTWTLLSATFTLHCPYTHAQHTFDLSDVLSCLCPHSELLLLSLFFLVTNVHLPVTQAETWNHSSLAHIPYVNTYRVLHL